MSALLVALTALSTPLDPTSIFSHLGSSSFVNFETPHVHPIEASDGRLLAVNTANNRLMIFDLAGSVPTLSHSVPVGLDPVSVRVAPDGMAWVVNHVSDTISIVDPATGDVVRIVATEDEPADVAFAGGRAFVSCSQVNRVLSYDLLDLGTSPTVIPIVGEEPRMLAVSADGSTVYAAIFESGNRSTVLGGGLEDLTTLAFPPNVVSDPTGPYGGANPPPNAGLQFSPPRSADASDRMPVSLIVKKDDSGRWRDDNIGDWTTLVSGAQATRSGRLPGWDLADHDVATIDVATGTVTYATGLMNICMAMDVHPVSGDLYVVGTDATNEVRFEPNLNGRFLRVNVARVDDQTLDGTVVDLNPHLDYSTSTIPQVERDRSLGDPRGVAWVGDRAFVTGMGSNNVVAIDETGARLSDPIEVGEGPTGLVAIGDTLYVMNKFDGSISVIDTQSGTETARVPFFDPTPESIRAGRRHLYDTHRNSGLGHVSCASCHVDARWDALAWDLGDPTLDEAPLTDRNLGFGHPLLDGNSPFVPDYEPFHPMKGPMSTQTLVDIIGHEPLHWRGDRLGLEEFNAAFIGLQGDDTNLTTEEMQEFEDFLSSLHFPPNPNRPLDNALPEDLPLDGHYTTGRFGAAGQPLPNGDATRGLAIYVNTNRRVDGGAFSCVTCHTLPTGTGPNLRFQGNQFNQIPAGPNGEAHHALVSVDGVTNVSMKIPQTRNMHEKTGFNTTQLVNTRGVGYLHDGSVDSIERFISEPAFDLNSDQEVADIVAFMLSFAGSDLPDGDPFDLEVPPGTHSQDAHAAVGHQVSMPGGDQNVLDTLLAIADTPKIGVVAHASGAEGARGYMFVSGEDFASDRASESVTTADLLALATTDHPVVFTAVPLGTEQRIGIDRDEDGWRDRDEADVCADPEDPTSFPGAFLNADVNADLEVNIFDLLAWLELFDASDAMADWNEDGSFDIFDVLEYLEAFDACS